MANTHAILAIVAAAMAALTALILVGVAVAVPAVFALAAGVYIAMKSADNKLVMASGVIAAIVGMLSFLGSLNGVSIGGFTVDFSVFSGGIAQALAILACLEISASALKVQWDNLPQVAGILTAVALVASVVLAFVFNAKLGVQTEAISYIVAVLALAGLYPAIQAMKA